MTAADAAGPLPKPDGGAGLTGAIVVGAGAGRRFGGVEKAFFSIAGRPLLCYAVDVFEQSPEVDVICLVLANASLERGASLVHKCSWRKVVAIVPGGRERQNSVRAGLDALQQCEWVLVHDAARPLVTGTMVRAGLQAARLDGAAVAAIPVRDTLKHVEPAPAPAPSTPHASTDRTQHSGLGIVRATVDRTGLWAAQTPQVFRAAMLRSAFDVAGDRAGAYSDDASLVEAAGYTVAIFPGAPANLKLTLPEDIAVVEALLRSRHSTDQGGQPDQHDQHDQYDQGGWRGQSDEDAPLPRAGTGYDIHRLVPGRRLVLGGVTIPSEMGLAGHSDGDVLTHAVIDALLGACGLPDIGHQFPPGDPAYRDADSLALLAPACRLARQAGWRPHNVDATVVCEWPHLASFLPAMRARIARVLELPESNVSVKAKTNEGLDAVGRGEAIAAHAIILMCDRPAGAS